MLYCSVQPLHSHVSGENWLPSLPNLKTDCHLPHRSLQCLFACQGVAFGEPTALPQITENITHEHPEISTLMITGNQNQTKNSRLQRKIQSNYFKVTIKSVLAKWKPVWKEFYCQGEYCESSSVTKHLIVTLIKNSQDSLPWLTPHWLHQLHQLPAANANKYILSSHKLVIKFEYGVPVTFPEATERLMTLGYQSRDLAK